MRCATRDPRPIPYRLWAGLAICACILDGCVPYPVEPSPLRGTEVSPSERASILPGVTTRQELQTRLGPPSFYWPDEKVAVYAWSMLDAHWKVFDVMPLVFGLVDVALVASDIASGRIVEYHPVDALLDDRTIGMRDGKTIYNLPFSSVTKKEHALTIAFDGRERVATYALLSGAAEQGQRSPEDWAREMLNARAQSLTADRQTRQDVEAMFGKPRYTSRDGGIALYEWPHARDQLLLVYADHGRIIEKRISDATDSDWDVQALALRMAALTMRPSFQDDARTLFGFPLRERMDGSAEIYASSVQHLLVEVGYDAERRVTSVRDVSGFPETSTSGSAWRMVRRAGETSVHVRVQVHVDGRSRSPFAANGQGGADTDSIRLFVDAASPAPPMDPRHQLLRSCGAAERVDGWIYFLLPPGTYELRAATSDLRDPVASSLSAVTPWRLEVPVGPSVIYAGTIDIDASESIPAAGRAPYLYNLQARVNAADLEGARRAAVKCDASWVVEQALPLRR